MERNCCPEDDGTSSFWNESSFALESPCEPWKVTLLYWWRISSLELGFIFLEPFFLLSGAAVYFNSICMGNILCFQLFTPNISEESAINMEP